MKVLQGWEHYTLDPFPVGLAQRLADMGAWGVRFWFNWDMWNPEPDVWKFDIVDESIDTIRTAGLNVYLNVVWAPAHASEDKPSYQHYDQGCYVWNRPPQPQGLHYGSEIDYCANPPHIDKAKVEAMAQKLADRYRGRVALWGIGNEPGINIYWPPSELTATMNDGDWEPAAKRFADELLEPFARVIRSRIPDAQITGIEADSGGFLQSILALEKSADAHWIDVIGIHPYAWSGPFPDDSLRRIRDEFLPCAADHRADRPVWITEVGYDIPANGDDGTRASQYVSTLQTTVPDIEAVTFHSSSIFFKQAPGLDWEPNDGYRDMQSLLGRSNPRHRATVFRNSNESPA